MDDEDLQWLLNEFSLIAEDAKERGIEPTEFITALRTYGKKFLNEYETSGTNGA